MRTIAAQQTINQTSSTSRTPYLSCAVLIMILTIANVVASVRSMYVGQSSYESATAVQNLNQEIKQLEMQKSASQSLAEVKNNAKAEGFISVDSVVFVSVPTSQAVAQR